MTRDAEEVLEALELPYRVVERCTGDVGFAAAKGYDLEAWSPGVGKLAGGQLLLQLHRFPGAAHEPALQARGRCATQLVHTLNGSALGMSRTYAALLETHLQPDGSIRIPAALAAAFRVGHHPLGRWVAATADVGSSHDRPAGPCLGATGASRGPAAGVEWAPHGPRLLSYLVDVLIISVLVTALTLILVAPMIMIAGASPEETLSAPMWVLVSLIVVAALAVSFRISSPGSGRGSGIDAGMRISGLKVVRDADGRQGLRRPGVAATGRLLDLSCSDVPRLGLDPHR